MKKEDFYGQSANFGHNFPLSSLHIFFDFYNYCWLVACHFIKSCPRRQFRIFSRCLQLSGMRHSIFWLKAKRTVDNFIIFRLPSTIEYIKYKNGKFNKNDESNAKTFWWCFGNKNLIIGEFGLPLAILLASLHNSFKPKMNPQKIKKAVNLGLHFISTDRIDYNGLSAGGQSNENVPQLL